MGRRTAGSRLSTPASTPWATPSTPRPPKPWRPSWPAATKPSSATTPPRPSGACAPGPRRPEVTAPHDRRRPGIRGHRTETLTRSDIRRHHNIRVTSPSRTILDIQSRLTDRQLVRAVNELRLQNHLRPAELTRLVNRSIRIGNLVDPQQAPTRSEMEDDFLAFAQKYGLPRPQLNAKLFGHEVDALFVAEKVIVETRQLDQPQGAPQLRVRSRARRRRRRARPPHRPHHLGAADPPPPQGGRAARSDAATAPGRGRRRVTLASPQTRS